MLTMQQDHEELREEKSEGHEEAHAATTTRPRLTKQPRQMRSASQAQEPVFDLWAEAPAVLPKRRFRSKPLEAPHPGTSYNPTKEEQQAALARALAEELRRDKRARQTTARQPVIRPATAEDYQLDSLHKMLRGEPEEEDMNAEASRAATADADTGTTEGAKRSHVEQERLTKAERKRRARRKADVVAAKKRADDKRLRREVHNMGALMREAEAEDERRTERRRVRKEVLKNRPARIGRHLLTTEAPRALLSDEVTGSLRTVPCVSSLLHDAQRRQELRGVVVPRVPKSELKTLHRRRVKKVKTLDPVQAFLKDRRRDGA